MKKLMLALLVAVVVFTPTVEGAYLGTLNASDGYSLDVKNTPVAAITILVVTRNGRLDVDGALVLFERGATDPLPPTVKIPSGVVRIIFLASAGQNGVGLIDIAQTTNGTTRHFEVGIAPDANIVFDIVP